MTLPFQPRPHRVTSSAGYLMVFFFFFCCKDLLAVLGLLGTFLSPCYRFKAPVSCGADRPKGVFIAQNMFLCLPDNIFTLSFSCVLLGILDYLLKSICQD